jgi:V8-like Glu-specific endopeptidase
MNNSTSVFSVSRKNDFRTQRKKMSEKRNIYIVLGLILGFMICSESATAIFGCKPVEHGEFDPIGIVESSPSESNGCDCTGTLIRGDLVLTAAHCFDCCDDSGCRDGSDCCCNSPPCDEHPKVKFTLYNIILKNGSNTGNNYSFDGTAYKHPNYNPANENDAAVYDLALIRLNENISKKLGVEPISVADSKNELLGVTIVGFETSSPPNCILQKNRCKSNFPPALSIYNDPWYAKTKKNRGICQGDSGAPAIINNQIVAIVSRYPENEPTMQLLSRTAYDKYDWIQKAIDGIICPP